MILGHPVSETVDDIADDGGVIAVEGIAAAAEIVILSARSQHVVDTVVDTLETHEGTGAVALCGMVENYIQIDLDLVFFQKPDQSLELGSLLVVLNGGRVRCIRRKKGNCIVSPVFKETFPVYSAGIDRLIKLEDGHQLYSRDPKALQMGDLLDNAGEGAGIAHAGGPVAGKSAHMHFIDDGILHLCAGEISFLPDKVVLDDTGVIGTRLLGCAPGPLSCDSLCVGVKDQFFAVKKKALRRIIGAVETITVFKLFNVELIDKNGIDPACTIALGDADDGIGNFCFTPEQKELTGSRVLGVDREINAACKSGRSIEHTIARSDPESRYLVKRLLGNDKRINNI